MHRAWLHPEALRWPSGKLTPRSNCIQAVLGVAGELLPWVQLWYLAHSLVLVFSPSGLTYTMSNGEDFLKYDLNLRDMRVLLS